MVELSFIKSLEMAIQDLDKEIAYTVNKNILSEMRAYRRELASRLANAQAQILINK